MSEKNDKIRDAFLEGYPDDVFLYYGEISREGYNLLSSAIESRIEKKEKAKMACLILVTLGGDPHAAFRIARALRHHYSMLDIFIPDRCKSAGTLICIAADTLIFGDRGELGPLDVQISKPGEFFENMSGLNLIQALDDLRDRMLESFKKMFEGISIETPLPTKQVAELAKELAKEFISPIVAKIDPITLGEQQRALRIAHEYGLRLIEMSDCGSLKREDNLASLIRDYPSHGFVIDRKEAKERLFNIVDTPPEGMVLLYEWVCDKLIPQKKSIYDSPVVKDVKQEHSEHKAYNDALEEAYSDAVKDLEQELREQEEHSDKSQSGKKADAAEDKKEVDQSD